MPRIIDKTMAFRAIFFTIKNICKRERHEKFIEAHEDNIHAELSSVDRIIFKGYSSLSWVENMTSYLSRNQILLKNFQKYAQSLSHHLWEHGLNLTR